MDSGFESVGDEMFGIFKSRKKKQKEKFLMHSLSKISGTVSHQTDVIRALSEQNREYTQTLKQKEDELKRVLLNYNKTNDVKLELSQSMYALEQREQESSCLKSKVNELKNINRSYEISINDQNQEIATLNVKTARKTEKLNALKAEKEELKRTIAQLQETLMTTKTKLQHADFNKKMLENELKHMTEMMGTEKKCREALKQKVQSTRAVLSNVQNETLDIKNIYEKKIQQMKSYTARLTKTSCKRKLEIDTLNRENVLIMSYCNKMLARSQAKESDLKKVPCGIKALLQSPTTCTALENYMPENTSAELSKLESEVFRKSQLIKELTSIIQQHDHSFCLETHPDLTIYLDTNLYERESYNLCDINTGTSLEDDIFNTCSIFELQQNKPYTTSAFKFQETNLDIDSTTGTTYVDSDINFIASPSFVGSGTCSTASSVDINFDTNTTASLQYTSCYMMTSESLHDNNSDCSSPSSFHDNSSNIVSSDSHEDSNSGMVSTSSVQVNNSNKQINRKCHTNNYVHRQYRPDTISLGRTLVKCDGIVKSHPARHHAMLI